jgi:excisionase family DNA binding protein
MSSTVLVAPASPSEPLLITAEEFAELMQVSVRSIWRLRSAREIPEPLRIGGNIRWRREEVMEWINAGCPSQASRNNDRRRR